MPDLQPQAHGGAIQGRRLPVDDDVVLAQHEAGSSQQAIADSLVVARRTVRDAIARARVARALAKAEESRAQMEAIQVQAAAGPSPIPVPPPVSTDPILRGATWLLASGASHAGAEVNLAGLGEAMPRASENHLWLYALALARYGDLLTIPYFLPDGSVYKTDLAMRDNCFLLTDAEVDYPSLRRMMNAARYDSVQDDLWVSEDCALRPRPYYRGYKVAEVTLG